MNFTHYIIGRVENGKLQVVMGVGLNTLAQAKKRLKAASKHHSNLSIWKVTTEPVTEV